MQTLTPAFKGQNLPTYYKEGDLVRLSRYGLCKITEASKHVLTVLDACGRLWEVTAAKDTSNVQRAN